MRVGPASPRLERRAFLFGSRTAANRLAFLISVHYEDIFVVRGLLQKQARTVRSTLATRRGIVLGPTNDEDNRATHEPLGGSTSERTRGASSASERQPYEMTVNSNLSPDDCEVVGGGLTAMPVRIGMAAIPARYSFVSTQVLIPKA